MICILFRNLSIELENAEKGISTLREKEAVIKVELISMIKQKKKILFLSEFLFNYCDVAFDKASKVQYYLDFC